MIAFETSANALLFSLSVQVPFVYLNHVQEAFLEVEWPKEIYSHPSAAEVVTTEGKLVFRGLRIKIGMHSGFAISQLDPTTSRMGKKSMNIY